MSLSNTLPISLQITQLRGKSLLTAAARTRFPGNVNNRPRRWSSSSSGRFDFCSVSVRSRGGLSVWYAVTYFTAAAAAAESEKGKQRERSSWRTFTKMDNSFESRQ